MFKLYGNIAYTWKKIDIATNEKDIVDTMIVCHDRYKLFDFMIIQRENNTDMIYKRTRTEEEYQEYLQDFKSRIKPLEDMSCVDLKRYILKKKTKK